MDLHLPPGRHSRPDLGTDHRNRPRPPRPRRGPDEARTLAQLRADITATWLLTNCCPRTDEMSRTKKAPILPRHKTNRKDQA